MTGGAGVDEEFDAFVRARYDRLCRVAYLSCGDWQHAEDLVQTALAKTYLAYRRGRVQSLDAYAFRVVTTTTVSWWRRRWHGELVSETLPDASGHDDLDVVDLRRTVLRAMAAISAPHRAVLALRYLADLSEEDTARALGCSVGTVKSRSARALAALRATGLLVELPTEEKNHV